MGAKRKITLLAILTLALFAATIILIVAINFREYGINAAKEKSKLTAEFVRDSLTAHMVNGIMDKRSYFLEKITNSENIKSLWLVRSKSVEEQFGKSTISDEHARDKIDIDVINSGKPAEKLTETSESVTLRMTIPYIANSHGTPNCLQCHNAKDGDVLGAISMVFDVTDVRSSGLDTTLKIVIVSFGVLFFALVAVNFLLKPYIELFENLVESIHFMKDGKFTKRVRTKLKDEAGEVAKWLNSLNEMLKGIVEDIDKKISILLSYSSSIYDKNPLVRTKEIIWELADIYKFKKTIELYESKEEIYESLYHLIKSRFEIKDIAFFEIDSKNSNRELLFPKTSEFWLYFENKEIESSAQDVIYADELENRATHYLEDGNRFINIKYHISQNFTILLSIAIADEREYNIAGEYIPLIFNYLDAIKPVVESRILMDMLKESSLRDALTGLYNRKFLDEYIDSVTSQALRVKTIYGILMVDIDHFKLVNDTYGHDIGDVVINGLANTLKDSIRESDLAIRFGGEEFIVLLYNPTILGALEVAEKVRTEFASKRFLAGKDEISKTISVGVAIFPDDAPSIWKGIKFADIALYKAKESGRNRVVRFKHDMINDAMS